MKRIKNGFITIDYWSKTSCNNPTCYLSAKLFLKIMSEKRIHLVIMRYISLYFKFNKLGGCATRNVYEKYENG